MTSQVLTSTKHDNSSDNNNSTNNKLADREHILDSNIQFHTHEIYERQQA